MFLWYQMNYWMKHSRQSWHECRAFGVKANNGTDAGSDNGLMSSGTKPLLESFLLRIILTDKTYLKFNVMPAQTCNYLSIISHHFCGDKSLYPLWRYQMETFSALLAFVRGIHRSSVNSLHKGQWRGALVFSLICAWINGWVNNR